MCSGWEESIAGVAGVADSRRGMAVEGPSEGIGCSIDFGPVAAAAVEGREEGRSLRSRLGGYSPP